MVNQVFTDVIRTLSSVSTIFMLLSPSIALWRIHKTKIIGETSVIPLVSLLLGCHMWLLYGILTDNIFPLTITYIFGDCISIFYVLVYLYYTPNRKYVIKACTWVGVPMAIVTIYSILGAWELAGESKHEVGLVVGWITVATSIILYSSPFETIVHVLRTRCATSIPINMCLMGAISNTFWTIYSFIKMDMILIMPNVICLTIGIIQCIVYWFFRPGGIGYKAPETDGDIQENKHDAPYSMVLTPRDSSSLAEPRIV